MSLLTYFDHEIIGITWRASLLIALIFALRPLLGRGLPSKVLPWLWLVVAIKLLFISAPAGWWSLYNLAAPGHGSSGAPALTSAVSAPSVDMTDSPASGLPPQLPSVPASGWTWNWPLLLTLGWLLGMALLAAVQIVACIRFHRQLACEDPWTGSRWQRLLNECADVTGLKTVPPLIETNVVGSPAVIGLCRPRLLVPQGLLARLAEEEVRLVFIHEFSHLRRRDLWLLTLFAVTRTVHWFNPLVWLAERALRADCEAACDAEVLQLTSSAAQHYGRTLLRLTQLSSRGKAPVLVAAISTNSNQTERRLQMIMQYRKSSRWMSLAAFALVATTVVLTLPNEVTAQEQSVAVSPALPTNAHSSREEILRKLRSIVIDIHVDKLDILQVVQFLQEKSKELDPDHQGVNFVLRLASEETPPADNGAAPAAPQKIYRKISLNLTGVPLGQVLQYVMEQSNLQYTIENYAVYIRSSVDEGEPLTVRAYLAPPSLFPDSQLHVTAPVGNDQAVTVSSVATDVKVELVSRGIRFPEGATATFLPGTSKLVVRDTPEQLDAIQNLIGQLSGQGNAPVAASPAPPSYAQSLILHNPHELQSITLSLAFNNATLEEAISFLSTKSKELDPDKKGIDFIIDPEASSSAKPITLNLNNVPLGEALRYVCQLAGVKFKVQEYAISVIPFNQNSDDLICRTFINVSPGFVAPNPLTAMKAKGIKFITPGSSVVYTPTTGQLTVVNTFDQLELLEELITASQAPTQPKR